MNTSKNPLLIGLLSLLGIALSIGAILLFGANWAYAASHVWHIYANYYHLPNLPFSVFIGVSTLVTIFKGNGKNLQSLFNQLSDNETKEEREKRERGPGYIATFAAPWFSVFVLHIFLFFFPLKPIVWPETTSTHVGTAAHVEATP